MGGKEIDALNGEKPFEKVELITVWLKSCPTRVLQIRRLCAVVEASVKTAQIPRKLLDKVLERLAYFNQ